MAGIKTLGFAVDDHDPRSWELYRFIADMDYVVRDPVEIVVETADGDRLKPPQEIRERVVRCRDCKNYRPAEDDEHEDGCALAYAYLFETSPDGFCAWGEEKGNEQIR